MASFELRSTSCDGHIRALSKAILCASRVHKDGLLEFTPEKMRICARTDLCLIKFIFSKEFFSDYKCDKKHRCYITFKSLHMPFKSLILTSDRDRNLRSEVKIRCTVEDELNNQIVFKIGAEPPAATLTYRLTINDIDPDRMKILSAINRQIDYASVEIAPKQSKKDRFLLSAFSSFAPEIDQVTIHTTMSEVKFRGSTSPMVNTLRTISEFTHRKDDFSTYNVKEEVKITVPLKCLKYFVNFVETNRVQTTSKYAFEGMGNPAHFIYDAQLFRGHFISSTPYECLSLDQDELEPLALLGPDESFVADENIVLPFEDDIQLENHLDNMEIEQDEFIEEGEDEEEDGYNDNESEKSDFLDGNLEGLQSSATSAAERPSYRYTNSIGAPESIRSEIHHDDEPYDEEKVRQVLNLDIEDPTELENIDIVYSSDSDSEFDDGDEY